MPRNGIISSGERRKISEKRNLLVSPSSAIFSRGARTQRFERTKLRFELPPQVGTPPSCITSSKFCNRWTLRCPCRTSCTPSRSAPGQARTCPLGDTCSAWTGSCTAWDNHPPVVPPSMSILGVGANQRPRLRTESCCRLSSTLPPLPKIPPREIYRPFRRPTRRGPRRLAGSSSDRRAAIPGDPELADPWNWWSAWAEWRSKPSSPYTERSNRSRRPPPPPSTPRNRLVAVASPSPPRGGRRRPSSSGRRSFRTTYDSAASDRDPRLPRRPGWRIGCNSPRPRCTISGGRPRGRGRRRRWRSRGGGRRWNDGRRGRGIGRSSPRSCRSCSSSPRICCSNRTASFDGCAWPWRGGGTWWCGRTTRGDRADSGMPLPAGVCWTFRNSTGPPLARPYTTAPARSPGSSRPAVSPLSRARNTPRSTARIPRPPRRTRRLRVNRASATTGNQVILEKRFE